MTKLDRLLAEVLDEDAASLDDDTLFASTSDWDSLKHVELVVGLETAFDVQLTADEIGRMTSKRAARAVLAARGRDA